MPSSEGNYHRRGPYLGEYANQDKMNDDDKKEIERLTKEVNTLKLAHETTLENH